MKNLSMIATLIPMRIKSFFLLKIYGIKSLFLLKAFGWTTDEFYTMQHNSSVLARFLLNNNATGALVLPRNELVKAQQIAGAVRKRGKDLYKLEFYGAAFDEAT